ncbi:hypothetical protein A1F94_013878 [Pyrenophora tritici-repentis]|nr:hypothetical protein A1F94_013878 [Pyrenophora tritici-repentis]
MYRLDPTSAQLGPNVMYTFVAPTFVESSYTRIPIHKITLATVIHQQTLIGKVAIVTGSAGGGIGEAIARELSDKGAHVVVNYPWKAEKAYAETVLSSLHTSEIVVEANLSTLEGPRILVEETVKEYSRIDNLINNASVAINKPLEETTLADWDLSTNLNGHVNKQVKLA